MNTQTLIEALRELNPAELDWKFALYSTHKSRDGQELDINSCKMQDVVSWVEALISTLLQKTLSERTVTEYTPFLPKELIGAIENSNELIRDQIGNIIDNTQNALVYSPEDFVSSVLPTPKGYAFYGCKKDGSGKVINKVLFMRRQNPFLAGGKTRLCTTEGDKIITSEKPLLKFTPITDFLMINDVCYFFTSSIEKDFGLESRHIAICQKRLGLIADASIVNNYDNLEQAAMKSARKFVDFENGILEHISSLSLLDRMDFLTTYGITTDNEGRMDTNDSEQCDLIIDLLCCRSCLDPLGRLAVGSNITPRQ